MKVLHPNNLTPNYGLCLFRLLVTPHVFTNKCERRKLLTTLDDQTSFKALITVAVTEAKKMIDYQRPGGDTV